MVRANQPSQVHYDQMMRHSTERSRPRPAQQAGHQVNPSDESQLRSAHVCGRLSNLLILGLLGWCGGCATTQSPSLRGARIYVAPVQVSETARSGHGLELGKALRAELNELIASGGLAEVATSPSASDKGYVLTVLVTRFDRRIAKGEEAHRQDRPIEIISLSGAIVVDSCRPNGDHFVLALPYRSSMRMSGINRLSPATKGGRPAEVRGPAKISAYTLSVAILRELGLVEEG